MLYLLFDVPVLVQKISKKFWEQSKKISNKAVFEKLTGNIFGLLSGSTAWVKKKSSKQRKRSQKIIFSKSNWIKFQKGRQTKPEEIGTLYKVVNTVKSKVWTLKIA